MPNPCTPPPWRRAFLRELARTGSVAAAAAVCDIDRSSAYQLRRRNPAFAASWARAQDAARHSLSPRGGGDLSRRGAILTEAPACPQGSLSRAAGLPASRGAGDQKGSRNGKLTLRPNETIRASKAGKCCIMRTGPGRWSAKAEAAFLAELTATANVRAAARAAGVSTTAAYNRRKLWPAFKAEWETAVAEGFARIETLVVCAATTTLDPEQLPERAWEEPPMTMDQALKVWLTHRAAKDPTGRRRLGGPPRREPDIEEVRQAILRKVAAIKRLREAAP